MRFCGAVFSIILIFLIKKTMKAIVDVHYPDINQALVAEAMQMFFDVRNIPWP